MMRPFSLLIKPAGPDCNLRCGYCFYLKKNRMFDNTKPHRMSDSTLEAMIRGYMKTSQPQYAFGWQGGEPTLMGKAFFQRAVEFQQKYGRPGSSVANGLQTNATLIDDEFAEFLGRYKFLLGVSLDGPADIHNQFRLNLAGRGSHSDVLRGIRALQKNSVEFNILVLVSQANVKRAREVYRYLCDQGFLFHQYIPCVEFDDQGNLTPFSICGEEWGTFMQEIYEAWFPADTRKVSIRHFDSIVNLLVTGERNVCTMGQNCCQYFVVEHNGDLFPCDFFVEERLKLGNIADTGWEEALSSPRYIEFGRQKSQWNEACKECNVLGLCAGDCLKHRLRHSTPEDPATLSVLCAGQKAFFEETRLGFQSLAEEIRCELEMARRAPVHPLRKDNHSAPPFGKDTGRNDACPCGSGKKFKRCCG